MVSNNGHCHGGRRARGMGRSGAGIAAVLAALVLTGCPGSGEDGIVGSDPASPEPGNGNEYSVSGTLSLAGNSSIDSDTNDPNQVDRRSNNSFATAQELDNPTLAVGYLNVAGEGPDGPSRDEGDIVDGYRTKLSAGQVIEVQFAADPATIDVDLYVYDESRDAVGLSIGRNSYECVRISTDGEYTIAPQLYTNNNASSGGTVYQMRIAAPGSASSCANATELGGSDIVAGQVVAQRVDAGRLAELRKRKNHIALPAPVVLKGNLQQNREALLQVPVDLGGMLVSQGLTKSADPQQALVRLQGQVPARTLRKLETIAYAKLLDHSDEYVSAVPNFRLQAMQVQPFPPNDRDYIKQRWHYDAIDLSGAINDLAGQPATGYEPIVAVLDSGIVADHPDLANQIVAGFDFVDDVSSGGDGDGIDSNPDDAGDSTGSSFHGSHVAGTIAAQTDNGIGGAGVAPMARIMPIRVLGKTGSGSYYDILQGVRFAAGLTNDSGRVPPRRADVINMSLGGAGACEAQAESIFRQARDAGVILVAASGNESRDTRLTAVGTPANCSNVIAIGATNPRKTRAYYSNGGANLTAVAPGGDVRRSTTGTGLADGVYSTVASISGGRRTPTYTIMQGTSMATPHAAGIFALMRYAAPEITPDQIEQGIASGAIVDDLGDAGRDIEFGFGQLNALKAVQYASQLAGAPPPSAGQISASPTALSLTGFNAPAEFQLRAVGTSTETVVSVTASNDNITVTPKPGEVDAATGLGTYVVTASAPAGATATAFANIVVALAPTRSFQIPVSLTNDSVGGSGGSFGPIYVLALDASTDDLTPTAQAVVLEPGDGGYRYSIDVPGLQQLIVVAGSDTDNDGAICNRGEACGAYPLLGDGQTEVLEPTGDLDGIDFSLVPFGGINAQALSVRDAATGKTRSLAAMLPALGREGIGIRRPGGAR